MISKESFIIIQRRRLEIIPVKHVKGQCTPQEVK